MNVLISELSNYLVSLHRYYKRVITIIMDLIFCFFCTWLAFVLRLEDLILLRDFNFYLAALYSLIAIPIFWMFGLYRTIYRHTGLSIFVAIILSTLAYGLIYFLIIGIYGIEGSSKSIGKFIPRSIGIIQPILLCFTVICSRLLIKYLLSKNFLINQKYNKKNVLVYGAGNAGRQLVIALENSTEFNVKGFLDDDDQLMRQVLLGQTVHSPKNLEELIRNKNISMVFLALPSVSRYERNQIIKRLSKFKLIVKTLPSISEIIGGRISLSDIKDLNIEDLLDREPVQPNKDLLNENIKNKIVCVVGAGGSIGSELCRQITKIKPKKLILIDLNEFAIYKIYEELVLNNLSLHILPILANAQDQEKISKIFETFKVNTVYHAAAYKHVPLVEGNICEGVKNNVFGTLAVAKAAIEKKVENFVFISSDKAVRPTNVMGATKRLAELCIQGLKEHFKNNEINFAIVRFGNVLESSGSVIPKFKQQIKKGGPVSLTHPDVTRYFMTLVEAAQLVIQAGAMGKNSEVYVLDMGKSIKIQNLINKMIKLSGLTIKNNHNPNGDIEIEIIGLRPGEKLYEELLIGENPISTIHPKIKKANDPFIPFNELETNLKNLLDLLNKENINEVKNLLQKLIESYKSNSEIVDHIYTEQISSIKIK
ncbi:polysaccharide biosynthesis protein [Candidatus Pelagibacter sp.]|nr:polysaccharide biosynthesis protein [Candidatus Pelagibacter sp.]